MDVRQGEGGISSKVASPSAIPITDDHRLQHVAPVMGAMEAGGAHSDRRTNLPRRCHGIFLLPARMATDIGFLTSHHSGPPFGGGLGTPTPSGKTTSPTAHTYP